MDKKELAAQFESLKELGIDLEFDDDTTDEEKIAILNELEGSLLGQMVDLQNASIEEALESTEDATLAVLSELAADIDPSAEDTIEKLTALANQPQADLPKNEQFANQGLYNLYDLLAEKSLVMTIDDYDPYDIGELLNYMLEIHDKAPIDDEVLAQIEDEMAEADYEEDYVWEAFQAELGKRDLTLIQLLPLAGAWSVAALIIIDIEKSRKWVNRGFGNYVLFGFYDEEID